MPSVDLIDETFVVATAAAVSAAVHDRTRVAAWSPDLELTVFQDRGEDGIRWTVTGGLVGTAEVWLEPFGDGVLMHVYVRCDVTRRGSPTLVAPTSERQALRIRARRSREIRQWSWSLKDELEAGRAAGEPRPAAT